ncbi:MAG: hypothetical protein IT559_00710 [Alphaproteobacteria bacterium]|nr:hypothetical protein [Alphaproteobacteria bacterium]
MKEKAPISPQFKTASNEGQWSIVLGGIPVNLNLEKKGLGFLSFADEWFSGTNHNYLEIRGPKGDVFRRLQAQEANMRPVGRMMAATYGSEGTDFSKDEIYSDDPNERGIPNMLRSGDNPEQTGTIFTGTKEQVLELYHQGLVGVINGNNQDLGYNALWGNNGNTFTAEVLEKMEEAAVAKGYKISSFDPKGDDAAFDRNKLDFPAGRGVCFASTEELLDAITILEEKISKQHEMIKIDSGVDLETKIPARAELACPSGMR